jgi:fatty-acyl-CoA synthase
VSQSAAGAPSFPSIVGQVLERSAARLPDKLALTFADRRWSYRELDRAAGRVAARLLGLGARPGDRIAAFGKNSDAYLLLYLGCARAGLVHVPVNFNARGDELAYLLTQPEPAAVFCDPALAATIDAIADRLGPIRRGSLRGERDVPLHALPLYHSAQMHCFLMPALAAGATNHLVEAPDLGEIFARVPRDGIDSLFFPPTVWVGVANHPAPADADLSGLRKLFYGASIMPVPVLHRLRDRLPQARFFNCFGQSEIGPLATVLRPEEHDARPDSVGRGLTPATCAGSTRRGTCSSWTGSRT